MIVRKTGWEFESDVSETSVWGFFFLNDREDWSLNIRGKKSVGTEMLKSQREEGKGYNSRLKV